MDAVLPKILRFTKNQLQILNVALVCKSFYRISIDDTVWQQFNVCDTADIYGHFLAARRLFSPLERLLWITPSHLWADILWDSECAPEAIQQWHPYTQLLLVTSRYRYDVFAKQVTNKQVIRLAIGVPLSYQHYAAFEDRELLLLSIKNRIPQKQLREIFSDYDDDYEVQMAVASFHGDYFTEFTHGQRELLMAALGTAPTRTPSRLAGVQIDDLELLEATLQIWDTWSLSFRPSQRLLEDPAASLLMAELCGVGLLNSYDPRRSLDRDLVLAHLKRRHLRGMRPNVEMNELVRYDPINDRNGAYQVELLAIDERLVASLNVADRPEILDMAMRRNPNVYFHHTNRAHAITVAARYSYSLALEQFAAEELKARRGQPTMRIDWDRVLAIQPRRFGRQQPQCTQFEEIAQRSDYGPCIYRNRIANTREEHDRLLDDQALLPYCRAQSVLKRRKIESFPARTARATILSLPEDLFYRIMDQTNPSPEDLARYGRVCRAFRKYFLRDRTWAFYNRTSDCFRFGKWYVFHESPVLRAAYRLRQDIKDIFTHPRPPPAPYIYLNPICLDRSPKRGYTRTAYCKIDTVHMDGIIESWYKHEAGSYSGQQIDTHMCGSNYDPELLWSDVGAAQLLYGRVLVPIDFCLGLIVGLIHELNLNTDYLRAILLQTWPWVVDFTIDKKIIPYFSWKTGVVVPHTPYDRALAVLILSCKPSVLPTFIQGHIRDKQVLILAARCKTKTNVYACIDPSLLKDRAFMIKFFGAYGWLIRFSGAEKLDEEYVTAAFKSFCDKRLLSMVKLRSRQVALAAISYDATLYWQFEYRDAEFNQLAMKANCNLWDTLKSIELAPIAAAQDYRCWFEVNKLFSIPEPETRKLNGYGKSKTEPQTPRRRMIVWKCEHRRNCTQRKEARKIIWERYARFAEYRVDFMKCYCDNSRPSPRPYYLRGRC